MQKNINVKLSRIIFQGDSYKVVVFRTLNGFDKKSFTACGNIPSLAKQEELIVTGVFKSNGKFGNQFHVKSWKRPVPNTKEQLVTFFSSNLFKGVGKKMADKIVKALGKQAIDKIIKEGSGCLKGIEGLKTSLSEEIVKTVQGNFVLNDLIDKYSNFNIQAETIIKAHAILGPKVIELQDNPYLLAEINLLHFDYVDDIGGEMGFSPYNDKRLKTAIKLMLKAHVVNQGHCFLEEKEFISHCLSLLNRRKKDIEDFVYDGLLIQAMEWSKECYLWKERVYPANLYFAERDVAQTVHHLSLGQNSVPEYKVKNAIKTFEKTSGSILSGKQKEAIYQLFIHNFLILTGGPGTGKTFTVNAIIEVYKQLFPDTKISLTAPTGRAAKRLGEVTGMGSHAQTIHRLLGLGYMGHEKALFDGTLQLPYDFNIVDEFSMADIQLASHYFKAIRRGTFNLIVGDPDQLPSVNPGNVLKDLLAAGIPNVKLDQVFRQAEQSTIVKNAHKINNGIMIDLENKPDNFFIESLDPFKTAGLIIKSVERFLNKGFDINDILILSPMKKGVLGIDNLNLLVRDKVNPKNINKEEVLFKNQLFRSGDKVMYTRNNKEADIYNGDIGTIQKVNGKYKTIFIDFNGKQVSLDKEEWKNLKLAYAMTIHKSQGSQSPVVFTVLSDEHSLMLMRNLFYTGMTRTEQIHVLFGTRNAVQKAIETNEVIERKTSLAHQLMEIRRNRSYNNAIS